MAKECNQDRPSVASEFTSVGREGYDSVRLHRSEIFSAQNSLDTQGFSPYPQIVRECKILSGQRYPDLVMTHEPRTAGEIPSIASARGQSLNRWSPFKENNSVKSCNYS